jgi:Zn-dependent M28 family amino/carboxypeptidase
MELARAAVGLEIAPARTLLFAAWNAEEAGMVGSCHYAEEPSYPLERTVAAYAIDMVGAGSGVGLYLAGATLPQAAFLAETMEASAAAMGLPYAVVAGEPLDASDHVCFVRGGVPGVAAASIGAHPYYHSPEDSIDHIALDDLESSAMLMWAGLLPLALGTESDLTGTGLPRPRSGPRASPPRIAPPWM